MVAIMREYHSTHPWIDFKFSLKHLLSHAWLKLGQIQAKCDQVSGVPLLPSVAQELHKVYLAKGVLATTAIEGNTLTEEEVRLLMQGLLELPPSKEYLKKEVENVLAAANWIMANLLGDAPAELRPEDIKQYNLLVLDGCPLKPEVTPGEYRHHNVWVANYKGAPPDDVALLVGELCDWLNSWPIPDDFKVAIGILKAIVAHVYIAWIHPFADGNGRTARLIELQLLLAAGFPTPAAHLLSNHYNQTRTEYYRFLDIASRDREEGIYQFVDYALQGFLDNLNDQLRYIEVQQLAVHWETYVHDHFRNRDGKTDTRRRRLVLDLSQKTEPVSFAEIRHVSPRIAEAYAGKTDITVRRDINALLDTGLILKTPEGIKANSEIMRAFLAQKRTQPAR